MSDSKADLSIVQQLLERIVQSPQHVIALDSDNPADTLAQLRTLAIRAGTSIYAWDPEGGISPLREAGLYVPGTKRLADALRYVLQSLHFGVYLFVDFADYLRPAETLFLRRISRLTMRSERKVVFMGDNVVLPEELEGVYGQLSARTQAPQRLRLRDGRWVP
ncbi:MAG: hypothetical protein KF903_03220 [Dokdonella sp.]|uniref:hypothetical protein n=1 Tax=Dokdonella sp. TaxID=2291710 RepID=UPI0025BB6223|nr:hypothetical protein [Dokdonella sp.]MBX3699993.1 hypothetical protein [Dokdonella sp.]MCW5578690.1 hypothetical protein [Dokdonella sp.]